MGRTKIRTPLGTLSAHVRNDPEYPGIDICLDRGDHSILLAWVEVDRHGSAPVLKLRLYADCKDDEPTDDRTIAPAELDEYFNGLANGVTELV